MAHFRTAAGVLVLVLAGSCPARAQVASMPDVRNPETVGARSSSSGTAAQPRQDQAASSRSARRRSAVHYNRFPYPEAYADDSRGGFRNPGGVGRGLMWYPPNNQFSGATGRDPVRVAQFMNSPSPFPTISENIAAQSLGVQKYNALQQHIDNYARPYFGYGLGMGYFGGFY